MTVSKRITSILTGLVMILLAFLMLIETDNSIIVISRFLSIFLIFSGIKTMHFYFTMARHMVGGRNMLINGVLRFSFGVFTVSTLDEPKIYVIIYLMSILGFTGLVSILRAFEARASEGAWMWKFAGGVGCILLSVFSFIFGVIKNDIDTVVLVYVLVIIYNAFSRIALAFRRTSIVYIQ